MASKNVIARRYAKALSASIEDAGLSEKIVSELETFVSMLRDEGELVDFLYSPSFLTQEKWNVVEDLLAKAGSENRTKEFLRTLVLANRIEVVGEVAQSFKELVYERVGKAEVLIESAYALTDSELAQVQANLEKTTGKKLVIKTDIKPDLVAGLKVTVEGQTIDGTLGSHLEKMQRTLLQAEA
jgi:F-type H+-transporting ATPase subunit delta